MSFRTVKKGNCSQPKEDFTVTPIRTNVKNTFASKWRVDAATGNITYVPEVANRPRASQSGRVTQQYRLNEPVRLRSEEVAPYVGGDQNVKFHRNVETERYRGQKPVSNFYYRSADSTAEPVSSTLYQTPTDEQRNMISTGTLVNPYLNETYETLVNQLPPPNTFQPITKKQLAAPNPKLIQMSGGIDIHQPTRHRTEQSLKPVSVLGGVAPQGTVAYEQQVGQLLKQYTNRDLFNNRNGEQVCERLIGEAPQGFVGLVPRHRLLPSVPATQNLDTGGRTTLAEISNADLRKREEHTGEFFSRRARVLVQRDIAPDRLINGVEAVSQIPIVTDRVQKDGNTQGWITPAFLEEAAQSYAHLDQNVRSRLYSEQTTASGPVEGFDQAGLPLQDAVKSTLKTVVMNHPLQQAGIQPQGNETTLLPQDPVKATLKTVVMNHPLQPAGIQSQGNETTLPATDLRAVPVKNALLQHPLPMHSVQAEQQSHVLQTLQNLRDTIKSQEQHPNPATTQPGNAGLALPTDEIRPTIKPDRAAPTTSIQPIAPHSYVPIDDIADTQRMTMPYAKHAAVFDGERLGDIAPLSNLTTQQYRGTEASQYLPALSKVVVDSGGSGVRIGVSAEQTKQSAQRQAYQFPEPLVGQVTPHLIPGFRLTERHFQEIQDLLDSQDGSEM